MVAQPGRVVLVTGAAGGIGTEVARLARARQDTVLVADLPSASLDEVVALGCVPVGLDVTDEGQWAGLAAGVSAEYGRLDALVHNAGVAVVKPMREMGAAEFRAVLDVNVLSVFLGTKAFADLLSGGGSVVNVASVSALVGQDAATGYVASKGAVVSLTRALATELAPSGVRVNCVCPGSTDTALLARHFDALPDGDDARAALVRRHPIGRLLTAGEVAEVISFLAGPASTGVTGAVWTVDGGLTATFDYGNSFAGGHHG
ncbi:SDR family NAD(P)-dependent oxidoreductase [Saccharothrix obliqua]|uniref:SDR family NAD(P)-dependent oxidoreductase n=1 Tax=Saccharothrix obliqua TaxID=2861747 RepID=UPI001C5E6063|nr:SDR family oxidoreductase [Saccharothrix obliqua]MBW4721379.1 SDR family oxidoreductase [Saccharothrix obliqua]